MERKRKHFLEIKRGRRERREEEEVKRKKEMYIRAEGRKKGIYTGKEKMGNNIIKY